MRRKILIEIDISPTNEAIKDYDGDVDCLMEDEIDSVLEKLRYSLDGFDVRKSGEYKTWGQTKVKVIVSQE